MECLDERERPQWLLSKADKLDSMKFSNGKRHKDSSVIYLHSPACMPKLLIISITMGIQKRWLRVMGMVRCSQFLKSINFRFRFVVVLLWVSGRHSSFRCFVGMKQEFNPFFRTLEQMMIDCVRSLVMKTWLSSFFGSLLMMQFVNNGDCAFVKTWKQKNYFKIFGFFQTTWILNKTLEDQIYKFRKSVNIRVTYFLYNPLKHHMTEDIIPSDNKDSKEQLTILTSRFSRTVDGDFYCFRVCRHLRRWCWDRYC